jgi:uncharacterized protein YgiM (DUF1202 family)
MMKYILVNIFAFLLSSIAYAATTKAGEYYVTADRLNVRLAPNKTGKITNTLYKREKVEVIEISSGWARISRYYDGSLEGLPDMVARWVFAKYLSSSRPSAKKEVKANSLIARAIKSSDDFLKHREVFISASEKLVNSGKCSLADFKEMGGW